MSKDTAKAGRKRRSPEEKIADLQREIERIKHAQKERSSPGLKQAKTGLGALRKALPLAETEGHNELISALNTAIGALTPIYGGKEGGGGTRIRRTAQDIEAVQDQIVEFLTDNPGSGISAIANSLGQTTQEVRGPLLEMLEDRRVSKKGERRATVYTLKSRRGRRS